MLASLKLWVFVNPQLHGACPVGTVSPCGACFQANLVSGPSCPSLTARGLVFVYGKHSNKERVARLESENMDSAFSSMGSQINLSEPSIPD